MMEESRIAKGAGFPPLHSCRRNGYPIHTSRLVWNIAANLFEAFTPEQLAPTWNMVFTFEAIAGRVVASLLSKWCTCDSEFRIARKLLQQKLQVVRVKRNIGVKITDHVILKFGEVFVCRIETVSFGCKAAIAVTRHVKSFNPVVTSRVLSDDIGSAVCRAVIDYDPLEGMNCLRNDRSNSVRQMPLLVSCGSNQKKPGQCNLGARIHVR